MKDLILDISIILMGILFIVTIVKFSFERNIKKEIMYGTLSLLFVYMFTFLLNLKY